MNLIGLRVYKARAYSKDWYCRWGAHSQNSLPIGTPGIIVNIHMDNHHVAWNGCLATTNHDISELE